MKWCALRAVPCSLSGPNDRDVNGDGSTRSDAKRTSLGPYEKTNTSRWNLGCGGAMLTRIPGKMAGGCEWPTAASMYGPAAERRDRNDCAGRDANHRRTRDRLIMRTSPERSKYPHYEER